MCFFFLLNLPLPFPVSCFSCLCALLNQVIGHSRHVSQTAREDFWFKPPTSRKTKRFSQEMTGHEPRAACEKVSLRQKVCKGIKNRMSRQEKLEIYKVQKVTEARIAPYYFFFWHRISWPELWCILSMLIAYSDCKSYYSESTRPKCCAPDHRMAAVLDFCNAAHGQFLIGPLKNVTQNSTLIAFF